MKVLYSVLVGISALFCFSIASGAQETSGTDGKWEISAGKKKEKIVELIDFTDLKQSAITGVVGKRKFSAHFSFLKTIFLCANNVYAGNPSGNVRIEIGGRQTKFSKKVFNANLGKNKNGAGCRWLPLESGQVLKIFMDGENGTASGTWSIID